MLDVDGKEWWQVCEQHQIMSCNLCKSVQTLTSNDHVEFWISQHRNSLFFLPTTLTNSLFSRWTTSPFTMDGLLPPSMNGLSSFTRWTASSLAQQMVSSLAQWTAFNEWSPSLNNWSPLSLNEWSLPLLDKWSPSSLDVPCSTNGPLPHLTNASLDNSLLSLAHGLLLPLTNSLFPPNEWSLPSWQMVTSLAQWTPSSLPGQMTSSIDKQLSLSMNDLSSLSQWMLSLPSLDEWLPPSIVAPNSPLYVHRSIPSPRFWPPCPLLVIIPVWLAERLPSFLGLLVNPRIRFKWSLMHDGQTGKTDSKLLAWVHIRLLLVVVCSAWKLG